MTKIGEGAEVPEKTPLDRYHKEIDENTSRFLNALESYKDGNSDERAHLKPIMDESLQLIRAAVKEIRRAGIAKQEAQVESDYKTYINSNNPQDLSVLEEDLSTLRDYNKLP